MLKIDNVSKQYKLGEIGGTTLRDELQRIGARIRGKGDPTKKIGAKDYNKGETFLALDGVSFEVKKGERVGIIGHNGAGKSTLLKLISRVTAPSKGRIDMNGRVASMLEVGTGFHPELTGRENIYMNGAILGMTKKEIDAKMEDIIEFSEVRQFIDTPVKRYSSGMYVKLAFSVAAHLDSEIMIMDEVLAVGDMAFQKKCLEKMSSVSKTESRTILYVSHNMNTIRQLCDRVVVLDHGKVVFDGDVEEGIGVYFGTNQDKSTVISFCEIERESWASINDVKMEGFLFVDKEMPIYTVGETLIGRLSYKCFHNLQNVYLRIVLKDNLGEPVTMAASSKGIVMKAGEHANLNFTLDISKIAPGIYQLGFLLYLTHNNGTYFDLDGLPNVAKFQIIPVEGFNHNIPWKKNMWGHYYTAEMKIAKGE